MAIIRNLIITMGIGMLCTLANAQGSMPSALDQLALECRQVSELNDTINARQARLDELKVRLDDIKRNWWQTCNDALSSPTCDDSNDRLSLIAELIGLTDSQFESDIYMQLENARNDATIRGLKPIDRSKSDSKRSAQSRQREQPTEERKDRADDSTSSPESQGTNTDSQSPVNSKHSGAGSQTGETRIDSKGQENRNKTINAMKDKYNKK